MLDEFSTTIRAISSFVIGPHLQQPSSFTANTDTIDLINNPDKVTKFTRVSFFDTRYAMGYDLGHELLARLAQARN